MRISSNQMSAAGLREMLARQAELQHTQIQLATQRRVLRPSDDPVAATSINLLQSEINNLEQNNRNADMAKSSNELEEGILSSATQILFRIKELVVSAGNGTYGKTELNAINTELSERLEELAGLANTQNANGDYIFSGSLVKTQTFSKDASGNYIFQGDQYQRYLNISSGVTVAQNDSGFDVFANVKNGNGKFITGSSAANTGTGFITPGSYTAPPEFLAEPYDISFAIGGGGQLEYTVTGRNSGTVVAGPTQYQDGGSIAFLGVDVIVQGGPLAGDLFSVDPSRSQSVFESIQNIVSSISSLVDTPEGRAKMISTVAANQESLDQNMQQIDIIRSKLGARLASVESEKASNQTLLVTTKTSLSDVKDLDVVEASSRLSQQTTILEAAQASFVRVQNLNLFNFLR